MLCRGNCHRFFHAAFQELRHLLDYIANPYHILGVGVQRYVWFSQFVDIFYQERIRLTLLDHINKCFPDSMKYRPFNPFLCRPVLHTTDNFNCVLHITHNRLRLQSRCRFCTFLTSHLSQVVSHDPLIQWYYSLVKVFLVVLNSSISSLSSDSSLKFAFHACRALNSFVANSLCPIRFF